MVKSFDLGSGNILLSCIVINGGRLFIFLILKSDVIDAQVAGNIVKSLYSNEYFITNVSKLLHNFFPALCISPVVCAMDMSLL